MPLRQGEARVVAKRAEQLHADALEGRRDQGEMPRARDPVEDDAGDADIVAIAARKPAATAAAVSVWP